jgi:hypothetical protein
MNERPAVEMFLRERGTDIYCPFDGECIVFDNHIGECPGECVGEFWYDADGQLHIQSDRLVQTPVFDISFHEIHVGAA